jgi:hypothetical protein
MSKLVILITALALALALALPDISLASTATSKEGRARGKPSQRPELTLTLTLAGIYTPATGHGDGVHAHAGTDLYFNEGATLFVGSGAELQYRSLHTDGAWGLSVAPVVRMGWAFTGDNKIPALLRRLPLLKVYAITGWRLPNAAQAGALRVGLGVSCFLISALLQGAPGTAEFALDTDFSTTSYHLRLGWGL